MRYGPKIVTDGLIVCYDAADNLSAPSSQLPVKQGCVAWLDGADDDVFTYSSGTLVSEWRDKSGKANHVANGTASEQPSRDATLNSKSVVNFDGTDDYLQSSVSLDLSSGSTMFAIVNCDNGSSDAGVISINSVLSHGITIHNGSLAYFYYGSGGYHTTQSTGGTGVDNIFTKVWNGTTSGNRISYKNGTQGYSTGTMSSSNSTGVYRLGKQTTCLDGKIAEIIIYERILTDAEITKVHNYLQNKWGKAVSDAKWYDMTVNANHGSVTSAPVYSESNKGSFAFDGTNDYISSSNYSLSGGQTFEVWFQITGGPDSPAGMLVQHDHAVPANFGINHVSSDKLAASISYTDGTREYSGKTTTTTFSHDVLYHVALVYDTSASKVIWYVNGAYDNQWTLSKTPAFASKPFVIGRWSTSYNNYYFDGNVYKASVYSKTLSATEVKQNFEATRQRFGL